MVLKILQPNGKIATKSYGHVGWDQPVVLVQLIDFVGLRSSAQPTLRTNFVVVLKLFGYKSAAAAGSFTQCHAQSQRLAISQDLRLQGGVWGVLGDDTCQRIGGVGGYAI